MGARTIVDKIWAAHRAPAADGSVLVDRIYVHERQLGLVGRLGRQGIAVRGAPGLVACADQQLPTQAPPGEAVDDLDPVTGELPGASAQVIATLERLEAASALLDIPVFGPGDHRGGVLNVVAPEQGMTLPGALVVGTDTHMATHGAMGAIGLSIDDDELAHLLATGSIERDEPPVLRVGVSGRLDPAVGAKDVALWLLAHLGPGAARDSVVELGGPVVRALPMDARMTLCNLLAESGAASAIIEPDEETARYLSGRPFAPTGSAWTEALHSWAGLRSDPGAPTDGALGLVATGVGPQVTWGTSAWQSTELAGVVPTPDERDPRRRALDEAALHDQGLVPGTPLDQVAIDQVFVGSCANGRIDDIRAVADMLRGGRVQVPTWVVPGSRTVARQAEAEGLHRAIRDAGADWRTSGCSLCIGANGDAVRPGTRLASTANRPRKGMVGPGARIHVLGPAAAAASALAGRLIDPRTVR
jgi:3-isopropylmalate/(R)-2-methylmalate dehydratase large subunit